jgi:hypothetical protein
MRLLVLGGSAAAVVTVAHTAAAPALPAPPPQTAAATHAASAAAAVNTSGAATHWRATARAHVGVLREPQDPARDAVPARVRAQPLLSGGVVDLAAAKKVRSGDGEAAWIAPSADGSALCAVRSGALACPPLSLLTVTGMAPGIIGRAGEPFHVWGIAGDDVSSVVLIEADGTRVPIRVVDNFFDVATDDWPRSLTWTGPSGPESFGFPAFSW